MKLCCYSKFWWSVTGVITVALALVGAVVSILYKRYTYEESLHLTSGDTRLISSYSHKFCERLRLENTGMPNNLETSLFIVPDLVPGMLSARNVFRTRIVDLSLARRRYHYWRVFLHPDSTVMLEACILNGTGMEFFILRNGRLNKWRAALDPRGHALDPHRRALGIPITNRCSEGRMQNKSLDPDDYDAEDVYYILLVGLDGRVVNVLNGTLYFEISEYSTDAESGDVYSHCTTGGGLVHPCSVRVPLDLGSHGVISAEATSLGLHSGIAAVDVKVSCEPRAWIYALMVVAPVVIAMTFCFISACVCGYNHYNRPQPAARGRDPPVAGVANPGRYNRLQPAEGGRNPVAGGDANPGNYNRLRPDYGGRDPAAGGDANPGNYNRPQPADGGRDPAAGGDANPGRYNRLQPAEGGRNPVAGGDANSGNYNRHQPVDGGGDPVAGGDANPGNYNRLQPVDGGGDPAAAAAVLANSPCNFHQ